MWIDRVVLITKNVPIAKILHWVQFHKDSINLRPKFLKRKFEFSHILRVCSYLYELCITISFEHVNSYAKIFKILHLQGGNATTQLTLVYMNKFWASVQMAGHFSSKLPPLYISLSVIANKPKNVPSGGCASPYKLAEKQQCQHSVWLFQENVNF